MSQLGFFDLSDHFSRLSERGDPLQALNKIIDFEGFCPILDIALPYSDSKKGDRPLTLWPCSKSGSLQYKAM